MGFRVPVDVDYFSHPKTVQLISIIGQGADVFPIRLWAWAAKFAKKGALSAPDMV